MVPRRCHNLHYINAIEGDLVRKLPNVDTQGKPVILFKKVKDIYEKGDDFKLQLQPSNPQSSQHSDSKPRSGRGKKKKNKDSCVLHVEICLQQLQPIRDESVCQGADEGVGSDLEEHDFGKITLKQLREKGKTKKRKGTCSIGSNSEESCVQFEAEKDDSDLNKPLSSLKLKLPKAKKKRARVALESKEVGISVVNVRNPYSDMRFPLDNTSLDHVTREIQEPTVATIDDFPSTNPENELSSDKLISSQMPMAIETETSEQTPFPEELESCTPKEVSCDQLEDTELSTRILSPSEEAMDEIHKETNSTHFVDLPITEVSSDDVEQPLCMIFPTKDQNSVINNCSMVLDPEVDDCNCTKFLHCDESLLLENGTEESDLPDLQIVAVNGPAMEISPSHNENPCSSPENEILSMEERLICNVAHNNANCGDTGMHLVLSGEYSTLNEEGQQTADPNVCEQRDFVQNCTAAENPSMSVPVRPERLLLTHKVLSLTSEEQLLLALNSEELQYHQECHGDQAKEGGTQVSSLGSDINNANDAESPMASGSVPQTNGIIGHTSMTKKLKHDRRHASPIKDLEGPCLSRVLPNLDSGSTSTQGCSESAIAFSQRQMQDINSLSTKLMDELRSVKDIVENKLLLQAYRRTSTSDVEEVSKAIRKATKTEETTKKWLTVMSRDCNRFCKIMSLTQKGANAGRATSNNVVQRQRKKISFADEAGGKLCHIKFFKDEMELESVVKQED